MNTTKRLSISLAAVVLIGTIGASPAFAEGVPASVEKKEIPNVSDSAEQKITTHFQEANLARLKGWPGMVFYCPTDEAKTPVLRQICVDIYKNLEELAMQHKVNFHKARNANDVAVLPHLTGRLKLEVHLETTEAGADPSAIAAHIEVLAHYAHAINRTAEFSAQDNVQNKHPLNVPQHVDSLLWESIVVKAAANQEQLAQPITAAVRERLNAFFADYDKANR